MLDFNNINLNILEEEFFNIDEFINTHKNNLNNSDLLQSGTFKNVSLIGDFKENYWVLSQYLTKGYTHIDFSKLEELTFIGIKNTDIDLIKCWVANAILDNVYEYYDSEDYNISPQIRTNYNYLVDFIIKSNNFSFDFIDNSKGSLIDNYFYDDTTSDGAKQDKINAILEYLTFIEDKHIEDKNSIIMIYIDKLNDLIGNYNHKLHSRILPNSENILLFDNYVKEFFTATTTPYDLKMYFYPILLWWKITNVIPFRISEFCLKINRDCLIDKEDGHYLKIGRLKKKANLGKNLLPIINELKISDDIYELIKDYISKTDSFGETKTLISYKASRHFRDELNKRNDELFSEKYFTADHKNSSDYFTQSNFSLLLKTFYEKIVQVYYKDTQITEQILPNDTRHFAFTSLILQGLSPIKVAILGGHRTLDAMDSYTSSPNTYINTEVITIIHKNLSEGTINRSKIKKIIFGKDSTCPNTDSAFNTYIDDIEIGCCTANFYNDDFPCKHEDCYKCSNWWCPPTEESYKILIGILSKRLIIDESKLDRDIKFMKSLFKKSALINIDDNIFVNKDIENAMKRTSISINSRVNKLILSKVNILDIEFNNNELDKAKEGLQIAINSLSNIDDYIDNTRNNGLI